MQRTIFVFAALALLLTGCKGKGGSATTPVVTLTAKIIVTQSGVRQANVPVVESSDYNASTNSPVNVIATQNTDSTGTTTFGIGNPNVKYCFSTTFFVPGTGQVNYFNCQNPFVSSTITLGT